MSSARNHAKRSHRSHHNMRANTYYSVRRMAIRSTNKPKLKKSISERLLNKIFKGGYSGES